MLSRVMVNLLSNARAAKLNEPDLHIRVELTRLANSARLRVIDNGPGVRADLADRVFEPLVSGYSNGLGLGLPVVRDIVQLLSLIHI